MALTRSISSSSAADRATRREDPRPIPVRRRWVGRAFTFTFRLLAAMLGNDLADAVDRLPEHRRVRDEADRYAVMRGFGR